MFKFRSGTSGLNEELGRRRGIKMMMMIGRESCTCGDV